VITLLGPKAATGAPFNELMPAGLPKMLVRIREIALTAPFA
jgi:hypothetical protein